MSPIAQGSIAAAIALAGRVAWLQLTPTWIRATVGNWLPATPVAVSLTIAGIGFGVGAASDAAKSARGVQIGTSIAAAATGAAIGIAAADAGSFALSLVQSK